MACWSYVDTPNQRYQGQRRRANPRCGEANLTRGHHRDTKLAPATTRGDRGVRGDKSAIAKQDPTRRARWVGTPEGDKALMAVKQNKNKVHIGIEPVPGDEQWTER